MQKICSMNCKITTTPDFARDLKQLSKRYPSIKQDFGHFLETLRETPQMGIPLGKHLRKVRFYNPQIKPCTFPKSNRAPFNAV